MENLCRFHPNRLFIHIGSFRLLFDRHRSIRSERLCDCLSLLFITERFKVAGLHEIHVCRKICRFLCIYLDSLIMLSVTINCKVEQILCLLICSLVSFFFHVSRVGLHCVALSQLYSTHFTVFLIIIWLTHFNRFPDKITAEIMRKKVWRFCVYKCYGWNSISFDYCVFMRNGGITASSSVM